MVAVAKTIARVTVHNISGTGAVPLIDPAGHERALFLDPFTTGDVVAAGRAVLAAQMRR